MKNHFLVGKKMQVEHDDKTIQFGIVEDVEYCEPVNFQAVIRVKFKPNDGGESFWMPPMFDMKQKPNHKTKKPH
jgi:hypothetical protein